MTAVTHGGATDAERAALRERGLQLVDLSASLNPYGPHPAVLAAARAAAVDRYPEPDAATLTAAYAREIGVEPECVLAGNGSSELIYLAARAFAQPGARALILGPTFGEYARAVTAANLHPETVAATPPHFDPPIPALLSALGMKDLSTPLSHSQMGEGLGVRARRGRGVSTPSLLFLCNPNNPTGRLLDAATLTTLAAATHAAGTTFIVDEAYAPFTLHPSPFTLSPRSPFTLHPSPFTLSPPSPFTLHPSPFTLSPPSPFTLHSSLFTLPSLLTLRSLTKLHSIPGLRLGFAVGDPAGIARLRALQPPWSVGAPALAAGLAALEQREFACTSVARIAETRDRLCDALASLGFGFVPSAANFLLVEVGDATTFRARLLGHGFAVRDCSSFGLPGHVRIAVPHDDDLPRLLTALERSR